MSTLDVRVQVPSRTPNQQNSNQIFPMRDGFGFCVFYRKQFFPNGMPCQPESKLRGHRLRCCFRSWSLLFPNKKRPQPPEGNYDLLCPIYFSVRPVERRCSTPPYRQSYFLTCSALTCISLKYGFIVACRQGFL